MKQPNIIQSFTKPAYLLALSMLFISNPIIANPQDDHVNTFGRGAEAWTNHCARCHNMREPTEYSDELWKPIVFHMRIRAGLTGQQTRDILHFLQTSN